MQQAQLLQRRMAVMNTRSAPIAETSNNSNLPSGSSGGSSNGSSYNNQMVSGNGTSGGISPSAVPSPAQSIGGMGSPHPPGIGLKPGTQTPPANVLKVVKQVIHFT